MTVVVAIAHREMDMAATWVVMVQKALKEEELRQAVSLWPTTALVTLPA